MRYIALVAVLLISACTNTRGVVSPSSTISSTNLTSGCTDRRIHFDPKDPRAIGIWNCTEEPIRLVGQMNHLDCKDTWGNAAESGVIPSGGFGTISLAMPSCKNKGQVDIHHWGQPSDCTNPTFTMGIIYEGGDDCSPPNETPKCEGPTTVWEELFTAQIHPFTEIPRCRWYRKKTTYCDGRVEYGEPVKECR